VLEEVENAIKDKAIELLKDITTVAASDPDADKLKAQRKAAFQEIFQLEPFPADDVIDTLTYDDMHVDLADYFDLVSGKS
jgi:hypothetical protein